MTVQNTSMKLREGWVEAITAFISEPPEGITKELLSQLAEAIEGSHGSLPPRVFYEAVQQSAVAISITDSHANILYANKSFTTITGYEVGDVIDKNESILSDKRTPKHIYQEMWDQLSNRLPWNGELINRRKNGERYIASLTIAPVLDKEGNITHFLGMHRDITERHKLSKEVSNHKKLIESVVDAAPVVIALLDHDGNVVRSNQAYRELATHMHGYDPVDKLWSEHKSGTMCSDTAENEVRLDLGGDVEARWFSCTCTTINENDTSVDAFFETKQQSYRILVAKEITDIKREQEAVKMNGLRALMAEEELVQGIREALTGALYQLQGPLNMVEAALNLVNRKRENINVSNLHSALQDALAAGSEAIHTLQSCLPAVSTEADKPVNVNELLQEVLVISTQRLLKNGIVVDWKPAMVLPATIGKEQKLRGVFKQIIDNAIDAMSDRSCRVRELTVRTESNNSDIKIIVDDTGQGIPEQQRIKVFQPFYTTKSHNGNRAGMGLSIAQETISEHSGNVIVTTSPGGGCRIEVQLPVRKLV